MRFDHRAKAVAAKNWMTNKILPSKRTFVDPTKEGYTVWDGITMSDYISKKFAISYPYVGARVYFTNLAFLKDITDALVSRR